MSLAGQATGQIAPSGASHHEGIVLGLLALIVIVRLVESKRLGNAWAAVFGGGGTGQPAPAAVPAVQPPNTRK